MSDAYIDWVQRSCVDREVASCVYLPIVDGTIASFITLRQNSPTDGHPCRPPNHPRPLLPVTGQKLTLRSDRERLWYEFLRSGFSTEDLKSVVAYLQKEIRASRRNVGALKLSNLLQLDRYKEDLNISKVRLRPTARLLSLHTH